MPLKKGSSKKTKKANFNELVKSKPSAKRQKAINTLAKRMGISRKAAKYKQAGIIAAVKAKS